jgi:hypothetical protein
VGHVFKGEFAADVFTNGTFTHANGAVVEGEFNVEGRTYWRGTVRFPNGCVYVHQPAHSGSFLARCASVVADVEEEDNARNMNVEQDLGALGAWPSLPDVSGEPRLPAALSEKLVTIQRKGGSLHLTDLEVKRAQALHSMKAARDSSLALLQQEHAEDTKQRALFGEYWTPEPSERLTQDLRRQLEEQDLLLDVLRDEDATLKAAVVEQLPELACLLPSVETIEHELREQEAKHPERVAVCEMLSKLHAMIADRAALIGQLKVEVGRLDVLPALVDDGGKSQEEELFAAELAKVQQLRDSIADNLAGQSELVQRASYAVQQPFASQLLATFVDPIERGISVFHVLEDQLSEACSNVESKYVSDVEPLSQKAGELCSSLGNIRAMALSRLVLFDNGDIYAGEMIDGKAVGPGAS